MASPAPPTTQGAPGTNLAPLKATNGTTSNGTNGTQAASSLDTDLPPGVILPPPHLHLGIRRTADFVSRRPVSFEAQISTRAIGNKDLTFAVEDSPYRPYFLWLVNEMRQGRQPLHSANAASKAAQGPQEPPHYQFSYRMPTISAVDLEILKTTTIFVAKHGRPWMVSLSQSEASNPQFNFLRPTHSLHLFFNTLVNHYKSLITGNSEEDGKLQKERMERLRANADNRFSALDRAKKRAEWLNHQQTVREKEEATKDAEDRAYKEIDWQDFVVVGTIEFTEADNDVELPAPTSLDELQSASLEQKAAFSIPVNRRLEETMPDDVLFHRAQDFVPPPAQLSSYAPPPPPQGYNQPMPPPQYAYPPQPQPSPSPYGAQLPPTPVGVQGYGAASPAPYPVLAPTPPVPTPSPGVPPGAAPMRIRNDYVPRAQTRRQAAPTVLCQICNQQVLESEYENHVKSTSCFSFLDRYALCTHARHFSSFALYSALNHNLFFHAPLSVSSFYIARR